MTAAYSPEGTLLYTYDNLGRLTGTFSGSLATINAYDALGRVKTVTDQSGAITTYSFAGCRLQKWGGRWLEPLWAKPRWGRSGLFLRWIR